MRTVKYFKWLLILTLMLVSGCVKNTSLEKVVSLGFERATIVPLPQGYNIDKNYMRYYLPVYVGRLEAYETSNVLMIDSRPMIVTLNVQSVIKDKYYNNAQVVGNYPISEGEASYFQNGTLIDYNELQFDYYFSAVRLENNEYYVQLLTNYLSMGAIAPKAAIEKTIDAMVMIARTMRISYDLVAVDFANREVGTFENTTVDLFQQIAPESGLLIDVLDQSRWDFKGEE